MARGSKKIPILMYHDIESGNSELDRLSIENRPYVLTESQFEEQMRLLFEQKYQTISLDKFVAHINLNKPLPEKSIIITFDDGHISNYLKAYPILQKYSFTATFFIVAGFVGRAGMLTWYQIQEMASNGMEIGSHTLTHTPPARLNPPELKYELEESRKILENHLNQKIRWLSSPTGYYNRTIEAIARDVGYEVVCTSKFGANVMGCDLFSLKRMAIKRSYTVSTFKSLIELRHPTIFRYKATDLMKSILRKALGSNIYESTRRQLLELQIQTT